MALELSRDITFGQYIATDSPLHRLDPRVKIVGTGLLILATFFLAAPAQFVVMSAALLALIQLSRVPGSYILRGMRLLLSGLLIVSVFQVLFYQPQPNEANVWWQWGIFSFTQTAVLRAVAVGIRVMILFNLTSLLMFTTSLVDLTDGTEALWSPLKRLGVPVNELVLVAVIAFKFVPIFVAEMERLVKAQTARGVRFDEGTFIRRAFRLGSVLIPIFISGFHRAETLTAAMEQRCYRGGRGRTKRRQFHMRARDRLALLAVAALAVLVVALGRT